MNLAGIFAWDIDFVLDIRTGDTFSIIVEELWRDGKRVAEGDILAAEFVNQGEQFRAIMYRSPDGTVSYFSPEGKNMRKAFLRAPLSFSRISSNFNPNRRHPVLNTIRAHKGVDYAAPSGTPIKAAGDGKVIFRGVKGGYGNTIILQHGGNITTLYAHMQRFNRAARNGMRVRQGTIIGYVGQSGLATGPHLHYEYRKNGVHMNPRTVKLPDAAPIDPALRADFDKVAAPLLAKLDRRNIGMVAQADTN
jgi:murein DD-endopeptidase MepM/ murein hydrolase activator NlpD